VYVLVVAALVLQMIGTYLIWPSRWNIPAHLALGFCVTAYLVPGLATNVWDFVDPATNALYAQINIFGAAAMIFGLFVGRKVALFDEVSKRFLKLYESPRVRAAAVRRIEFISTYAVLGMVAAYIIMGFVPMFAADPFAAKQFKDQYFVPYHRAAYLFRGSFSILVAAIPLLFIIWWIRRRRLKPLLLGISAVGLITVSLARQSSALGVLTFLGLIGARSRRGTRRFLFLSAVIYPLGSAAYLILGLLTGIRSFTTIYSVNSIADIVSSGAPDIHDQINFLSGFRYLNTFTYGKTFWGGLVPGNYMWNPSVWTLTYDNPGADISDWVTGGLRFSTALWGYCNFGWIGVLLIPFLSGMLAGSMIRALRKLPLDKSLLATALVMSVYMTFGSQITEFFALSIHNIPSILCALYACFGLPRLFRRRQGAAQTLTPAH
jgi:hypothetical protein